MRKYTQEQIQENLHKGDFFNKTAQNNRATHWTSEET